MTERLVFGADHAGFELKEALKREAAALGHVVEDVGTDGPASCDYPDFGHAAAERVARGTSGAAVLVCGSGVGMAMVANRHPGVRAVVCSEPYSARMARVHNDANVLCLGARVVGSGLAVEILRAFLGARFEGGRHAGRVRKIERS